MTETTTTATKTEPKYFPEHRIYKPNPAKNGAASKLQFKIKQERYREGQLFWVAAQQTGLDENGNASFGWDSTEQKVTMKLDTPDIGEILAVLNGKKDSVGQPPKEGSKFPAGLFHKNAAGSTTMQFAKVAGKDGKHDYYAVRLASKKGEALVEAKHTITLGEGEVLRIILEDAISAMYNWRD